MKGLFFSIGLDDPIKQGKMPSYPLNFNVMYITHLELLFQSIYSLNFTHVPNQYFSWFAVNKLTEYSHDMHVSINITQFNRLRPIDERENNFEREKPRRETIYIVKCQFESQEKEMIMVPPTILPFSLVRWKYKFEMWMLDLGLNLRG